MFRKCELFHNIPVQIIVAQGSDELCFIINGSALLNCPVSKTIAAFNGSAFNRCHIIDLFFALGGHIFDRIYISPAVLTLIIEMLRLSTSHFLPFLRLTTGAGSLPKSR